MTVQTTQRRGGGYLERPAPSGLADVIEIILDKGIVIDAYVRVSLVGIELLTIDARIVIASVDTYLRFAEATNRLDLYEQGGKDLTEVVGDLQEGGAVEEDERCHQGREEGDHGSEQATTTRTTAPTGQEVLAPSPEPRMPDPAPQPARCRLLRLRRGAGGRRGSRRPPRARRCGGAVIEATGSPRPWVRSPSTVRPGGAPT